MNLKQGEFIKKNQHLDPLERNCTTKIKRIEQRPHRRDRSKEH